METDYYWDYRRGNTVTYRYVLPDELADESRHGDAQESLVRALARTTLDHPMLQAVLVDSRERVPQFARIQRLDLDKLVTWHTVEASEDYGTAADRIVNEHVNKRFDEAEALPGWRILATTSGNLGFVDVHLLVRHTMFDGESRKIFHRSLLDHLNNPLSDSESSSLFSHGHTLELASRGDNVAFPPAMENFGKFTLGPGYVVSKTWHELKPSFLAKATETQRSWGAVKTDDYETEYRTIRVDAATAQKIVETCRSHKTTVTGFVHGVVLASLLWECREDVKKQSFLTGSAINLRRFMKDRPRTMPDVEMDPHKTIVNMLTVIDHEFSEADVKRLSALIKPAGENSNDCRHYEDVLWEAARMTRREIEQKLESGLKNDVMSLMKLVHDWRPEKRRMAKKPRAESWTVTNIGAVDGQPSSGSADKSKQWHVDHAVIIPSVDVARSMFVLGVISVKGGDLCISVAWQSGLNDYVARIGERLTQDIHSWCHYVASSGSEWPTNWESRGFSEHLKTEKPVL